jgi:bifunctional non-homologous end joining protein LigD
MLAATAPEAFDDDDFLFEPKWDGVRAIAVCVEGETMLLSRNERDITATYPELGRMHQQLVTTGAVIDGEIVALDGGRPSFERLQSRINLANAHDIARAMRKIPVTFFAFDVLYLDRRSVIDQPLEARKRALEELVVESGIVRVSTPVVEGAGLALSDAITSSNLEGIVAKRRTSPYRPGRRSREWLKIKVTHEADVVVGGWSPGEGSRSDAFGSLLVGAHDDVGLRFLGAVGTGFDGRSLAEVLALLEECESDECPFGDDCRDLRTGAFGRPLRNAHWVEPLLVARVEFRELTSARRLRAPVFKGLRRDKRPEECLVADLVPAEV